MPAELEYRLMLCWMATLVAYGVAWGFDAPQWVQFVCVSFGMLCLGAMRGARLGFASDTTALWRAFALQKERRAEDDEDRESYPLMYQPPLIDLYTHEELAAVERVLREHRPTPEMVEADEAEWKAFLAKKKVEEALKES
jgi:hypothetical protein